MITIHNMSNKNTLPPSNEWEVKCDRSSILGNPYKMNGKSNEERNRVCDLYEEYFYKQIEENNEFKQEVARLYSIYMKWGKLNLYCWCAPKKCHGITIKNYILEMKEVYDLSLLACDKFVDSMEGVLI